jgi:hypothetical protein
MGSLAAGRRQLNGWMSGHEQHEGWAAATLWLDGWASAARRLGGGSAAGYGWRRMFWVTIRSLRGVIGEV